MALRERNLRTSVYALVSVAAVLLAAAPRAQSDDECLVGVKDQASGNVADQATLCAEAQNKKCTFNLAVCVNLAESGCAAGEIRRGTGAGAPDRAAARDRVVRRAFEQVGSRRRSPVRLLDPRVLVRLTARKTDALSDRRRSAAAA